MIESKGRITTIGSISGIGTWIGGGDYTMSKHAIEAFSDTLALEMARFDVKASAVWKGGSTVPSTKNRTKLQQPSDTRCSIRIPSCATWLCRIAEKQPGRLGQHYAGSPSAMKGRNTLFPAMN
ncbi:MAG: SDR family NAD(P)-dependent oxidoreductase [Gammaproteobacteria bacterium]|nr:SDR family NAD(P)-dependent oxidoreductase [Gammaproteobacteria bacterium]